MKLSIKKNWYIYFTALVLVAQAIVFLFFREDSYIQVHDNLDLFVAHYQMMKLNKAWFGENVSLPMLHGISRDLLGSEFLLYNVLYIIFKPFVAYILGYGLKIAVGIFSFTLLFKDIYGEKYIKYKPSIAMCALAYGLIPVFPTYGIAFTSIPFIVYLIRKLYLDGNNSILLYIGVFLYPIFSYFSYFGFFILAYICLATIILWIKDKKLSFRMCVAIVILSVGYVLFEYRLFRAMLFDDTVTIRSTMVRNDLPFLEALKAGFTELLNASFHNQDSHGYFVIFAVVVAIIIINLAYVKMGALKKIWSEPLNLTVLCLIFNSFIFGICQFAPFRNFLEMLVPPLKGFDFSRAVFLNPFLWYAALSFACISFIEKTNKIYKTIAYLAATMAVLVVMLIPQVYNDFYSTVYNQAYKIIKDRETSTLSYGEFYSSKLFNTIKEDINYQGEWSAAYGFHPAVLVYNGVHTLDGYLGMYSQEYKDIWCSVEEPAFAGSPSLKTYYRESGARVCLYSGSDENTYSPLRKIALSDNSLKVNMEVLKELECKYIFSRVEFSNADTLKLKLKGRYTDTTSAYEIYVYEVVG